MYHTPQSGTMNFNQQQLGMIYQIFHECDNCVTLSNLQLRLREKYGFEVNKQILIHNLRHLQNMLILTRLIDGEIVIFCIGYDTYSLIKEIVYSFHKRSINGDGSSIINITVEEWTRKLEERLGISLLNKYDILEFLSNSTMLELFDNNRKVRLTPSSHASSHRSASQTAQSQLQLQLQTQSQQQMRPSFVKLRDLNRHIWNEEIMKQQLSLIIKEWCNLRLKFEVNNSNRLNCYIYFNNDHEAAQAKQLIGQNRRLFESNLIRQQQQRRQLELQQQQHMQNQQIQQNGLSPVVIQPPTLGKVVPTVQSM